jgi:hypothetical protein
MRERKKLQNGVKLAVKYNVSAVGKAGDEMLSERISGVSGDTE